MRDIPIQVLAHFPIPNYKNPETRGPALIYINGILIGITIGLVLLRIYTRVFIKRRMGADDWFIIIAAIFTIGLTAAVVLANNRYQWDRHIWDVPFNRIARLGQIAMAAKLLFTFATFFTRLSLLCFYYRIIHDTSLKTYRWVLHAAGIFNAMVFVAFVFLAIFQCSPISAYWIFPASGKCMNEGKLTLACGVINCVLDLLITTLPIPMVMKLQMHSRQRASVIVLLSLGFVVTIAGIIRTYFIWKSLVLSYDETWFAYPLWIAAAVEVDLAVICACAPAIRPFLLMYLRPLVTSLSGSRSNKSRGRSNGYISTRSGPSSQNYSSMMEAAFDEKISAIDIREGKSPTMKLSLTKTPQNDRLTIMQRVSWEVDYEDQPKLRRGLSLNSENEHDIGNALSSTSDKEKHISAGRPRSQSVDLVEATRRYNLFPPPRLHSVESVSPSAWTETEASQSRGSIIPRKNIRDGETFWISDTENSSKSTEFKPSPDLQNGERRWNIERNPFRDGQQENNRMPKQPARVFEGARVIEMKAFGRSRSLQNKDRRNGK